MPPSEKNSSATPSAQIPLLANRPNAVTHEATESNRTEQDRTRSTDKTMTKLSIFAHPDDMILSNTLEFIEYAPSEKNSSDTPSAQIPPLANRPNAVTHEATESNRTEQARTRSTDKTMTKLSITAHLDRTILSNTQEIVAHALAGKSPETLSTRLRRPLGRRVAI